VIYEHFRLPKVYQTAHESPDHPVTSHWISSYSRFRLSGRRKGLIAKWFLVGVLLCLASGGNRSEGTTYPCVSESPARLYIAFVEELPGANSQGDTLDEARTNLQEAVQLVLKANRALML
jgi:predicted RNase H-like HicB family nuclease